MIESFASRVAPAPADIVNQTIFIGVFVFPYICIYIHTHLYLYLYIYSNVCCDEKVDPCGGGSSAKYGLTAFYFTPRHYELAV